MIKLNGKIYIKGNVAITRMAQAKFAEMGVAIRPADIGGQFKIFYLTKEEAAMFVHRSGNPAMAGGLDLSA